MVKEGFAASLTEAATPSGNRDRLGRLATPQQFEHALAAVQKGPLPSAALDQSGLQQTFAGELR
jgi:hypothetical protein